MTDIRPATLRADEPAARLRSLGPRALSNRELIAVLLPGAGHDAIALADRVLRRYPNLRELAAAHPEALDSVPGIGPASASRVLAALELAHRIDAESRPERPRFSMPRDVYEHMRLGMRDLPHEEFHVLLLDTQNRVIRTLQVTRGTLDASLVHPREVFRPAIEASAASVILVHNHPSGDPTPSAEDRAVTRQLRAAGATVGIEVLDHVIVGEGRYVSFTEAGLLDEPPAALRRVAESDDCAPGWAGSEQFHSPRRE